MSYSILNTEDSEALNYWLDQREREAIAEQEHLDWIYFGEEDYQAYKRAWEESRQDSLDYIEI